MRTFALVALSAVALAAAPEQIHISYTQTDGVLAVDFVAADAAGTASVSLSAGGPWQSLATSSFNMPEVGYMHQALLPLNITTPGKAGFYKVATASGESTVFPVFPTPAHHEVFAVFGEAKGGREGDAAPQAMCVSLNNFFPFPPPLRAGDFGLVRISLTHRTAPVSRACPARVLACRAAPRNHTPRLASISSFTRAMTSA